MPLVVPAPVSPARPLIGHQALVPASDWLVSPALTTPGSRGRAEAGSGHSASQVSQPPVALTDPGGQHT